jgi:hypothetical protein
MFRKLSSASANFSIESFAFSFDFRVNSSSFPLAFCNFWTIDSCVFAIDASSVGEMKSVESVSAKEEEKEDGEEEEVVATAAPSSPLGDARLVVAVANASEFVIVFLCICICSSDVLKRKKNRDREKSSHKKSEETHNSYYYNIHTYIIKYGRQRHHRERIHERHAGGEKSERGIGALGGHFFRLRRVYASVRRVDGDLGIYIRERERENFLQRARTRDGRIRAAAQK